MCCRCGSAGPRWGQALLSPGLLHLRRAPLFAGALFAGAFPPRCVGQARAGFRCSAAPSADRANGPGAESRAAWRHGRRRWSQGPYEANGRSSGYPGLLARRRVAELETPRAGGCVGAGRSSPAPGERAAPGLRLWEGATRPRGARPGSISPRRRTWRCVRWGLSWRSGAVPAWQRPDLIRCCRAGHAAGRARPARRERSRAARNRPPGAD